LVPGFSFIGGVAKKVNLDVKNIFAWLHTEHRWRCSCTSYLFSTFTFLFHGGENNNSQDVRCCRNLLKGVEAIDRVTIVVVVVVLVLFISLIIF
jgi:hypothetical protein